MWVDLDIVSISCNKRVVFFSDAVTFWELKQKVVIFSCFIFSWESDSFMVSF